MTRTDLAVAATFVLAAAVTFWKLNPADMPVIVDTQVYFFIAERAASGVPPHISEFDPKNALSMLLTAAAIRLGRIVGADDLMSARALSMAVTAAAFPMLWLCAWRLFASRLAAFVAPMVLLLFTDYLSLAVAGSRPKVVLVFFLIAWMLAMTTRRPLLIGALASTCFLTWQPALLVLPVALLAVGWTSTRARRDVAMMLAGAVLPLLCYETYFLAHGALREQLYQSLIFPAQYGKDAPDLELNLTRIFSMEEGRGVRMVAMALYSAVLATWWVLALAAPALRRRWTSARPDRIALMLAATGTLTFIVLDYQGFPDRFLILPFIALADAWALAAVANALRPLAARAVAMPKGALRAGGLVLAAVIALGWAATRPYQQYRGRGLAEQRQAAAYVGSLLEKGKAVYVVSSLHLLAMNRTANHTQHGFFPVRIRRYMAERVREEGRFLPLKDGRLPDFILTSRMQPPGMPTLLRSYRELRRPLMRAQGIAVHRLRKDVKPTPLPAATRPRRHPQRDPAPADAQRIR
ncbi:MAG TPA: hypothetical protein VEC57_07215 [Candidatus Limnocylindrales bacterium]|nr:hypothetical protein [Candidatus Limnocylindrales bacterium]